MHYRLMAIKVARGGKVIGEFETKEIPWRVEQGVLAKTDYYWTAGMQDWKPLSELLDKPTQQPSQSSGTGIWDVLTFGLFTGWFASGSRGDDSGGGGFWGPGPGPENQDIEDDEELNERLADIAEDERDLMASDDDGDGGYDGDA